MGNAQPKTKELKLAKEYRIYKPNKNMDKGAALAFQLSKKDSDHGPKYNIFMTAAKQLPKDENGNDRFDWDNGIIVNIGLADIGKILTAVKEQKSLDIFHETPSGGNKVIKMQYNDQYQNHYWTISFKHNDESKRIGIAVNIDEFYVIEILFRQFIIKDHEWDL